MITQVFELDVIPGAVPTIVHLKQYQTDVEIQFRLFSRVGELEISVLASNCTIRGTKKDGNGYSGSASYSNGVVTVHVNEQMTAIAGMNPFEITLTDSTGKMITATFFLDVQRAALDGNTIASESVVEEIGQFLENHPEYYTAATDDLIIVDDDEPEAERNKLWIKPVGEQEIQIPTYEEFEDEIADLQSAISDIESEISGVSDLVGSGVIE